MDWNAIADSIWKWLSEFGGNLLVAGIILLAGWWLSGVACKLVRRGMVKTKADPLVYGFIGSLVKAAVLVVAAISAIAQLGVNITALIAALGAAGLTASFALQGSLSSLVSGIQIIFTKPFEMGDYLAFETYEGTVDRIEILSTTLATFDNKLVIVPNSKITSGIVVNYTRSGTRRLDLRYAVSYKTNLQDAKAVLEKQIMGDSRVLADPAPVIAVDALQDSSVTLVAKVWCKQDEYWSLYHAMQEKVKIAFDEGGIAIPFPQLDVHIDKATPLQ